MQNIYVTRLGWYNNYLTYMYIFLWNKVDFKLTHMPETWSVPREASGFSIKPMWKNINLSYHRAHDLCNMSWLMLCKCDFHCFTSLCEILKVNFELKHMPELWSVQREAWDFSMKPMCKNIILNLKGLSKRNTKLYFQKHVSVLNKG